VGVPHGTRVPTDRQIRALHERYAPTTAAFERVYVHCEIVCRIAEQLMESLGDTVDIELVRAGCLLHDIGAYPLFDSGGNLPEATYIRHGVIGHELLRELGYPQWLCRFCSCHTGVGLSRTDVKRQRLPLPVRDYLARSDEERLVMYADKFHSKTVPPAFVTASAYASAVGRFGADKVSRFAGLRQRFGEPDLAPLAREYGHPVD
jgi:uncharacterized protein